MMNLSDKEEKNDGNHLDITREINIDEILDPDNNQESNKSNKD